MKRKPIFAAALALAAPFASAQLSNPQLAGNMLSWVGGTNQSNAWSSLAYANSISSSTLGAAATESASASSSEVNLALTSWVAATTGADCGTSDTGTISLNVAAGYYTFQESWIGVANGVPLLFGSSETQSAALLWMPTGGDNLSAVVYGADWSDSPTDTDYYQTTGHISWTGYLPAGTVELSGSLFESVQGASTSANGVGKLFESFSAAPAPELPGFIPLAVLAGAAGLLKVKRS